MWYGHAAQPGCSVTGGPAEIAAEAAADCCSACCRVLRKHKGQVRQALKLPEHLQSSGHWTVTGVEYLGAHWICCSSCCFCAWQLDSACASEDCADTCK